MKPTSITFFKMTLSFKYTMFFFNHSIILQFKSLMGTFYVTKYNCGKIPKPILHFYSARVKDISSFFGKHPKCFFNKIIYKAFLAFTLLFKLLQKNQTFPRKVCEENKVSFSFTHLKAFQCYLVVNPLWTLKLFINQL